MCLVSCLSTGMALAKMTGIVAFSSLRRASTMVPDWGSHRAPVAKTQLLQQYGMLVVIVGCNKYSGFVMFLLISSIVTQLACD